MEKEILLLESDLWGALNCIFVQGLGTLPYPEDDNLAETAFDIFDQVPDIDFQPTEIPLDVFRFLQQFAQECLNISAFLLSEDEREKVEAFIAE